MKPQIQLNIGKLVEYVGIDRPREILGILGIDPQDLPGYADIDDSVEWHCGVEDQWWSIEAVQWNLDDYYAVRFTRTPEAGIDDLEIIERVDDEADADSLHEWLCEIAAECGSCDGQVRPSV